MAEFFEIVLGLMFIVGFYLFVGWLRLRSTKSSTLQPYVEPAADRLGWPVQMVAMDDNWTRQKTAVGEIEGIPARVVRMEVNRGAKRVETAEILMVQIEFPAKNVFLMTRRFASQPELREVERKLPEEETFHPDIVARHDGELPEILQREDVVDVIGRLQGAYGCIKLKDGWFSIGGAASSYEDVDIDVEHLTELALLLRDQVVLDFGAAGAEKDEEAEVERVEHVEST